jgi:aminopeptidase
MGTISEGARQAVNNCMKITSKDKVLIVTDTNTLSIAESIRIESERITGDICLLNLDDFGKRPLSEFPNKIAQEAGEATAIFYMAEQFKGEKDSLRGPLIRSSTESGRQAHMPGITKDLMEQGMCTNYEEIQKLSKKLFDIVCKAEKIQVLTDKGTNFIAEFSPKLKWIIADGDIPNQANKWSNLPDGEVFTCVKSIYGTVIIDGSLGDYFRKYGVIEETPIKIEIENSRIISLECSNKELEEELKNYIKQDENANRIGEFAIGTNIGLKKLVGNLLQDEKFPGVHIAIGHGYPSHTGSNWDSKAHLDMVIQRTNIIVDGKKIMSCGVFQI